jgi:hypothetical protein
MGFKDYLKETASGGSIGAGSIAANPSGDSRRSDHRSSESEWRGNAKADSEKAAKEKAHYAEMRKKIDQAKAAKKKQKGKSFRDFLLRRKVNEDFDMTDLLSRLKSADVETTGEDIGVVSYGVEDDKNNVMRITVRADQAKEFEETIARQLADAKSNRSNGIAVKGNSLAEILYNLRNKFEIISVDFPIIPKDVVYNADQATEAPADGAFSDVDDFSQSMDEEGDLGMGDENTDLGGTGGDLGQSTDQGLDQSGGADLNAGDIGGDNDNLGGAGEPLAGGPTEDEGTEDENVQDFGMETPAEEDEGSILSQIVNMLKAQANAKEAEANAAAEEARAKQAEWSAIAADKEVSRQEELARVEAQVQAQKKKEKEAKKYADLARFNVSQAKGPSSSQFESFLPSALAILKEDEFDNPQTLQKQKLQLQQKYKILPTDDQITQNYKRQKYQIELKQLNARIDGAKLDQEYQNAEANQQKTQQQNQPNQQQQQTNTNNNGPAQPANTTPQSPTGPQNGPIQ